MLSKTIYESASKMIPGGVNSPVRSFQGLDMTPIVAESGEGPFLIDVDGIKRIDFCMSWGALILGHAHPKVIKGVMEQLSQGSSFGLLTSIEEKMARKVLEMLPFIDKIRFVNSGTEATMTAMRLARGYSQKNKIVKFSGHYHGHSDGLLIQAGSGVMGINPLSTSKGVPLSTISDTICLPFNDFPSLEKYLTLEQDIAAVMLEPIAANMGVVPPKKGLLEALRKKTEEIGALLIFDEVITGFRVGAQGSYSLFQIQPDLICLGKIIGGGFPVAAVGGREDILNQLAPLGEVYQAGTLSGNPVAMRAGLETLLELEKPGFYEELEKKTRHFTRPIEELIERKNLNASLNRVGSMFTLFFGAKKVASQEDLKNLNEPVFAKFFKHLLKHGIYIPPSSKEAWFLSSLHTNEDLDLASHVILNFLESLDPLDLELRLCD